MSHTIGFKLNQKKILETYERLEGHVVKTPVFTVPVWRKSPFSGFEEVVLKLELLQKGGTFKTRGAINSMLSYSKKEIASGFVTVSAGNHAIAVAYAAKKFQADLKVYMPKSANPYRVSMVRELGADLTILETTHDAFDKAVLTAKKESRVLVHPFSSASIFEATASLGYEFLNQKKDLDALIVPVGGGGLMAGMATAFREMKPECELFGVEPYGADAMYLSRQKQDMVTIPKIDTIADSLGAPATTMEVFRVFEESKVQLVRVSDEELKRAMSLLFHELKMAVEPAAAAATAALIGPLRERLLGKRVGVLLCGANIDLETFYGYGLPKISEISF